MKLKQATLGCVAALLGITAAHAQTAGSIYLSTGWFHFAPQDSSDPLKVLSTGGTPVNQYQAGTGAGIDSSDTLGFSAGYMITDHIAAETELGVPPKFDLEGAGSFSQYGTLGTAKQWSPAIIFKYYFRDPAATFRPYVGLGATYVWFTDAQITNSQFESGVLHGPTSVSTDRSWAPVFNLGFNYAFTKHWFAGASVSYIPLSVTAHLSSEATTPVGTLNVQSEAHIKLNPIVTFIKIGYVF